MNRAEHLEAAWAVKPSTLAAVAKWLADTEDRVVDDPSVLQAASRAPSRAGGVAVLPLRGVITPRASLLSLLFGGGGGLQSFRQQLKQAVADPEIGTIVLDIDSPGGHTDLVPETAAEIREARSVKPVVAVANTGAASAAYWLASQADEIVVTPSGDVGSIGVYTLHEDWSGFDERMGIRSTLISAGKFKVEGNPYEPLSDEARAAIQERVDDVYGMFVTDVAKGRKVTAADVRSGFGEGRMLPAKRAVKLGMADRVDTLEATLIRLLRNPSSARRSSASSEDEPVVCASGHPTRAREGDETILPCGCVLDGATAQALEAAGSPAADEAVEDEQQDNVVLLPGAERLLARRAVRDASGPAGR